MSKLGQWLKETRTKRSAFAAEIGVAPSYVTLLCSDSPAWPGRDVATKIREATRGAVTADDFLPTAQGEGTCSPP